MSTKKQIVQLSRAEFAEAFLYLNGKPFSLKDYPHMVDVYNSGADRVVMKTSRQVSKSTTLANMMLANAAMIPFHRQLFVSPAVAQTTEFSRSKLEPVIQLSPFFRKHLLDPALVQNVFKKEFKNGSVIDMRYALLTADRIRGISTDRIYFDEAQDLRQDVIGVIEETMNRSLWKKVVYAGTPKRTKGTLADLWFGSTQNEYAVKSHRCGHWNILGYDNIGQHGLICSKCGLPLDLKIDKGEWVSTYSALQKPQIEGFRVSALHFSHAPWVDWQKDIIYKMENQSRQIFYNETLGLEYDSGSVPITKQELINACDENTPLLPEPDAHAKGRLGIMGIDYGPVSSENSNTVVVVLQERGGYLQIVYAKKFLGKEADPAYIHEEIPKLMEKWNCQILAADHGMGEASNSEIRRRIGYERVVAFQHLPSQKLPIQWNPNLPAYTLNKSQILDRIMAAIKGGKLKFPRWQDWEPLVEDFQNLIIEYDEIKNTRRYDHIGPDDLVHATTYAACAAMMAFENVQGYI